MNFQPLFTTARVVTAVYRVASTTLLLIYLAHQLRHGRKFSNPQRNNYREPDRLR
jgi:hypothetical protein